MSDKNKNFLLKSNTPVSQVHKHQLCDGHEDCAGGADESRSICLTLSKKTCQRRLISNTTLELPLPVSWLCDGEVDCLDGIDEREEEWQVCGSGEERKCYPNTPEFNCSEGFKCPDKYSTYVSMAQLCNYDESCGGAERVLCEVTKGSSATTQDSILTVNSSQYIPPCLPGIPGDNCTRIVVPPLTELATVTTIHLPAGLQYGNSSNTSCQNVSSSASTQFYSF